MSRHPDVAIPHRYPREGTVDRRTFLARAAALGVTFTAGAVLSDTLFRHGSAVRPWDSAVFAPPGPARVSVIRTASYDPSLLEERVLDGLRSIRAAVAGKSVLVKPNFVEYDPHSAINTDPRLVAATVLALRRMGAGSVTVAEGPGHRRDTVYVMQRSGMLDALAAVDAPFVDLNTDEVVAKRLDSSYTTLGSLWLPRTVVESDVVVSMPKMKTHHWAGLTLSLKNCFGCVPGRIYGWPKNALHWAGLEQAILDVAGAVRPNYAIIDGVVGMQGNGPISGTPVRPGLLVFGDDPVATDVIGARLMGFDPEKVPYLKEAGRFLGQSRLDRITSTGENVGTETRRFAVMPQFRSMMA